MTFNSTGKTRSSKKLNLGHIPLVLSKDIWQDLENLSLRQGWLLNYHEQREIKQIFMKDDEVAE